MKNIAITIFCILILMGCKKSIPDYRNKFVGNYSFNVNYYKWRMGAPPLGGEKDTTFFYNGKVKLGSTDSTVYIYFADGVSTFFFYGYPTEFTIYEDGTLKGFNIDFIGEFESVSSVKLYGGYDYLSGSDYYDVTGKKSK